MEPQWSPAMLLFTKEDVSNYSYRSQESPGCWHDPLLSGSDPPLDLPSGSYFVFFLSRSLTQASREQTVNRRSLTALEQIDRSDSRATCCLLCCCSCNTSCREARRRWIIFRSSCSCSSLVSTHPLPPSGRQKNARFICFVLVKRFFSLPGLYEISVIFPA